MHQRIAQLEMDNRRLQADLITKDRMIAALAPAS